MVKEYFFRNLPWFYARKLNIFPFFSMQKWQNPLKKIKNILNIYTDTNQ
jgi:hypothetical protein